MVTAGNATAKTRTTTVNFLYTTFHLTNRPRSSAIIPNIRTDVLNSRTSGARQIDNEIWNDILAPVKIQEVLVQR